MSKKNKIKFVKYFPKPLKIYETCRPTKILCYTVSDYHLMETEIAKYSHTHTLIYTALQEKGPGPNLW